MTLTKREEWVLADLKAHTCVSSWDWESDGRFAYAFNMNTEALDAARGSQAVYAHRIAAGRDHPSSKRITQARLRVLRSLVNKDLVQAYWAGTGPGGATDFGVARTRNYMLRSTTR